MRPELRQRILAIEDNFTERKSEGVKPGELRRTLVAFANSVPEGRTAVLFLGVTNDGQIGGISNPDKLQKRLREVSEDCYPGISYCVEAGEIEGKIVIAVEIPSSSKKPHFSGPAYIRIGSESVLASETQYKELITSHHSRAGAILNLKSQLVTVETLRKKLGSSENINDSRFRERHTCRIEDCTPHYVRLYDINKNISASEPLENVTISYDEKQYRPMLVIQPSS